MVQVTFFWGAVLLFSNSCSALVARATLPPSFSVQEIGETFDSTFPNVTRDGGGGGLINGNQLIVFSDTSTTKNGQLVGFTSNSVAYSSAGVPTTLTDFGSNGVPQLGIPFLANETAMTASLQSSGSRVVIWPGSAIAPMPDGITGMAVYGVAIIDSSGAGTSLYSTMVQYTPTVNGSGASRAVPVLFQPDETQYGSFSAAISNFDGNLLLFGTASDGLKVARVNAAHATDLSQYTYWDGETWSSTPVSPSTTDGNIFTNWAPLSSGDLFYSPYLNTWVAIYFDGWADSTFYMRYSLNGHVTGEWSDGVVLYTTMPSASIYNYAGHAYPGYDATGKTILLSWTYDSGYTKMARVTFA